MVKYVLLKSVVPNTFDGGFRCSGYETVEMYETDNPVELQKGILESIILGVAKKETDKILSRKR